MAERRLYTPRWSEKILDEMKRNILQNLDVEEASLDYMIDCMRSAFPEALVENFGHLEEQMTNDPKDRHVLAAAVSGNADVLVTHNVKDFPQAASDPYGIEIQDPDAFLQDRLLESPEVLVEVIIQQAADKTDPPMTSSEVLQALEKVVPNFVEDMKVFLQ